jgi:hypothetical protein
MNDFLLAESKELELQLAQIGRSALDLIPT